MITVTRTSPDTLTQEHWDFEIIHNIGIDKIKVVLSHYVRATRENTRKHLFTDKKKVYDRYSTRHYAFGEDIGITDPTLVPLPDDVKAEALAAVKVEFCLKLER
jgi:hypothetical protein